MMTTLSLYPGRRCSSWSPGSPGEARGFHPADVSLRSLYGLLYLIVFGSLVAFTALNWLLERCSPTLVITHSYVNPIVALLLGWAVAGERIDLSVLLAAFLVVSAIVLVRHAEDDGPGASSSGG
jgi:drug/metabolite transporter (DMT)-like permease